MSSGGVELDRRVDSIRVGARLRKDLGDLDELCSSIELLGLLQPITITPEGILVCGARRLAAVKLLGWQTVKVWVTSAVSCRLTEVLAEQHENTIRKPLTPTEAAALYAELKQLYAQDAARRQQATLFTSEQNPRHQRANDGGAESAPPSELARPGSGKVRQQAARAITGRSSHTSLEHVIEVQRLAADPTASQELRQLAHAELAGMDTDGKINGHYMTVKAAASAEEAELARAAQAAIARVTSNTSDSETSTGSEAKNDGCAPGRPATTRRYGSRAFLATIEEVDGWWSHYDAQEIACALSEEQWERACAFLHGSIALIEAIGAARGCELHITGRRTPTART